MLDDIHKKFIEDYMTFACKFCYDVRGYTSCEKIYTRCLDKANFMAIKMIEKGWVKSQINP
jgi:hypothetical protein